MKIRKFKLSALFFATCLGAVMMSTAGAESAKMKTAADIPPGIVIPDAVDTRLWRI